MENKRKTKEWIAILTSMFVIALILFFGGFFLYQILNNYAPPYANSIIAIYAAISGGICTMVGVMLTIVHDREINSSNIQEQYKPEFFCPHTYDISKADRIALFKGDSRRIEIANHNYYFQNSDKSDFRIETVIFGNDVYQANSFYIQKGKLFCLCFKSKEIIDELIIIIKSLDDVSYKASVLIKEKKVTIVEGY